MTIQDFIKSSLTSSPNKINKLIYNLLVYTDNNLGGRLCFAQNLLLTCIIFILSLTNIILNVTEELPYPLYETIFCGLVLLGIILPFIPIFAEFDRYPIILFAHLSFLRRWHSTRWWI